MRNQLTQQRATRLRRQLTEAEQHLWQQLRRKQLAGARFRRQFPIGPYIADFVCISARLLIELDGGQHQAQHNYDIERDTYLQQHSFRVLRFWNNEVLQNTEGVLTVILRTLEAGDTDSK